MSESVKQERVKALEEVMNCVRGEILEGCLGTGMSMLCETEKNGYFHGYTENYIEVRVKNNGYKPNDIVKIKLEKIENGGEFVTCISPEE